jgi:hypothetical protein
VSTGGGLGKFAIKADAFEAEVKNTLKADAHGIFIGYDPVKDKDNDGTISAEEQSAYDNQVLVSLNDASVTITKLNLEGALAPYRVVTVQQSRIGSATQRVFNLARLVSSIPANSVSVASWNYRYLSRYS